MPHVLATHFRFLRRQGIAPEEAEELTQGFFAELLERRSLRTVRKEKGRLRSFLLRGLKYFLANEQPARDGDQAGKRTTAYSVGRIAC